ncbi:FAD-dependent oxidoreductase [Anaerobacillus sp. CMMVII]|uniref:FAD-dependent oxidoreductase n=1 Tax=Anaerobacillus sp. CMMVII TaxID=2755588 RepID=UPI0021B8247F|nr:FAD-dependent oxidoreductase [Anaerobacillus sp. CMMVII]MCT8137060.1 FAD-dependent oxidoreductase [Anaerobacillus sp. CMMVII]
MKTVIQTKEIPVVKKVDVLVAGGGPAGIAAAIASARNGAKTVLLEKHGFLGGMGTAALVNPFMSYFSGRTQLVKGVFQEVVDRLKERGAYGGTGHAWSFEPEEYKFTLNELALESGVELLFHTYVVDAVTEDGSITGVVIESKSGRQVIEAKAYIDCTGDGDLAARAGAEFKVGRESDGQVQPASIMFKMGGVNNRRKAWEYAVEDARLPQGRVLFFKMPREGEVVINMTRIVNVNALDGEDLSRAEIEGRKQVKEIVDYLVENVEGFDNAYLITTGPQIGIRESRRIMGEYVLKTEDVLECQKFDDAIAHCSYMIDIHNPTGAGTEKVILPKGQWYDIPYRCLLPKDLNNLLVAGRCISATHEAHSSLRIQPTCYALGEAAGVAASIAVQESISPKQVSVEKIREKIDLVVSHA